jgi:foldase protein PrsA
MEMKTRLLLVPLCLAAVAALAAGCGGGSNSVSADAIAVVGGTPITKTTFTNLIKVGLANYKAHGQAPPKVGTPLYTQLKDQAVTFLVQTEELMQEGQKIGVTVTQKDIDAKVAAIKAQYYGGSQAKLLAALNKNNISLAAFEQYELKDQQLLPQKIYDKVTSSVKVSKADAKKYYDQNKASFSTPAATTREVAHILVKTKSLANKLEQKLKNGASFATLAKKYSTDTGSGQNGGKLCISKTGQSGSCIPTVPPFAKVAFSLKTGETSKPVHSQYGWHVIRALGPVKNTPAHTQSFSQAEAQIQQQLLTTKKGQAWSAWLAKLKKDYQGKVNYQTGYAPVTTTTPTLTTPTTTG